MKGIYVALPVFGKVAVSQALRYGLPTLLSPGNLPALASAFPLKLLLCTTQQDLGTLLSSPLIRAARDKMAVRAIPMGADMAELTAKLGRPPSSGDLLNAGHQYALDLAAQDDFGLVCSLPGGLYADGSFATVAEQIRAGRRAMAGARVSLDESALAALLPQRPEDGAPLAIPPRALARLAAQAPHLTTRSRIWGAEPFTGEPSLLYWRLGGHGFLLRGWHLHPAFVHGDRKAMIGTGIDEDLLAGVLSSSEDCVVLTDSDQFLLADVVASAGPGAVVSSRRAEPATVAAWLTERTKPIHRETFARRTIWIHDGIDPKDWQPVETEAERVISDIASRQAARQAPPPITREQLQDRTTAEGLLRNWAAQLETNPAEVAKFCITLISINPSVPLAYEVAAAALRRLGNEPLLAQIMNTARYAGLAPLDRGDVAASAAFFSELEAIAPEIAMPYARLFGQVSAMTTAYRSTRLMPSGRSPRRRLIISLAVWGERYVDLMARCVIPSMLAPRNLPALTAMREVHFDIYTTAEDAERLSQTAAFQALTAYAQIQFIHFAPEILTSAEYRVNPTLRYRIFGAFHHLSFDRARALDADVMPTNPDCVHSDGALTSYARFIDQGYEAILVTAIRSQAEVVMPILDGFRDAETQALTIPPRKLVEINLRHVHQAHKGFVLTKGNRELPLDPSVLFFPHEHGAYVRCLHIHPIFLSATALKRDVRFDYYTVDMNCITNLFPAPGDWQKMKVVQDSDDAFMMDITYAYGSPIEPQNREFTLEHLLERAPGYIGHHFWSFQHRINFHCDATLDGITVYNRRPDGSLSPELLPVNARVDLDDEQVAAWLETNRPKPAGPQ